MKIIMDSLVPNHRKKQLIPDRIMEPPTHTHTHTHTLAKTNHYKTDFLK